MGIKNPRHLVTPRGRIGNPELICTLWSAGNYVKNQRHYDNQLSELRFRKNETTRIGRVWRANANRDESLLNLLTFQ